MALVFFHEISNHVVVGVTPMNGPELIGATARPFGWIEAVYLLVEVVGARAGHVQLEWLDISNPSRLGGFDRAAHF